MIPSVGRIVYYWPHEWNEDEITLMPRSPWEEKYLERWVDNEDDPEWFRSKDFKWYLHGIDDGPIAAHIIRVDSRGRYSGSSMAEDDFQVTVRLMIPEQCLIQAVFKEVSWEFEQLSKTERRALVTGQALPTEAVMDVNLIVADPTPDEYRQFIVRETLTRRFFDLQPTYTNVRQPGCWSWPERFEC